jgi:hypothetical protein
MLSVIIATLNSERALVPTLAPLVPGATNGLVAEVLIADGGSTDETAMVADIAGCNFMAVAGTLGRRLKAAAEAARAPWLLFLRPGTVLDTTWVHEAGRFIERGKPDIRAAVFRRSAPAQAAWREIWLVFVAAIGRRAGPAQGLLISRAFYREIGGHSERAADPEAELLARIGRLRIMTLSSSALAGQILD